MKTSIFATVVFFSTICNFYLSGCSVNNVQVKTVNSSAYPAAIEKAKKDKRYFIMQSGVNLYTITSVDLDQAKQEMTVTLDKLDSVHLIYFKNPAQVRTIPLKGEPSMPAEIHVYMRDSISYTMDEPHTIPLQKVARVELLGKN